MDCNTLKLKGCKIKKSTFGSRRFNFPNRDLTNDFFKLKVRSQWKVPILEVAGVVIDDFVVFNYTGLESLPIGNYIVDFWAEFNGIAIALIAQEDLRISSEGCDCFSQSNETTFNQQFVEEIINYTLNIQGGGSGSNLSISIVDGELIITGGSVDLVDGELILN